MDIRYSCNQRDFKRYTTEETRKEFLIETLFVADQVMAVYSHVDRMVTLGVMRYEKLIAFAKARDLPMTLEDTRPDNAEAARQYLARLA